CRSHLWILSIPKIYGIGWIHREKQAMNCSRSLTIPTSRMVTCSPLMSTARAVQSIPHGPQHETGTKDLWRSSRLKANLRRIRYYLPPMSSQTTKYLRFYLVIRPDVLQKFLAVLFDKPTKMVSRCRIRRDTTLTRWELLAAPILITPVFLT